MFKTDKSEVKAKLDHYYRIYNQPSFIENDPISVPHKFADRQDKEIAGFFAATLSWGQRPVILQKANELMERMDGAPFQFVLHATEKDLRGLHGFKHRTFNDTDLLYLVEFMRQHFLLYDSLEDLFLGQDGKEALANFHEQLFSLDFAPRRTQKHFGNPMRGSACKRMNMYLRWMVRSDHQGVDFGIWNRISPARLFIPLDVHVHRIARSFGLINRQQADWKTVEELTHALRNFDVHDPVKYDFALFALGVNKVEDY
jgi:uncharacterized protein (TIGR02757 family)